MADGSLILFYSLVFCQREEAAAVLKCRPAAGGRLKQQAGTNTIEQTQSAFSRYPFLIRPPTFRRGIHLPPLSRTTLKCSMKLTLKQKISHVAAPLRRSRFEKFQLIGVSRRRLAPAICLCSVGPRCLFNFSFFGNKVANQADILFIFKAESRDTPQKEIQSAEIFE